MCLNSLTPLYTTRYVSYIQHSVQAKYPTLDQASHKTPIQTN